MATAVTDQSHPPRSVNAALTLSHGRLAVAWIGAVIGENVPPPPTLAAVHGGDWFVKLVIVAAIVGVWR